MSERRTYSAIGSVVALIALTSICPPSAVAQSGAFEEGYEVPRTPFGHPDLQGIWSNAVITPLERPEELGDKAVLTEAEAEEYERQRVAATNRDNRSEDGLADTLNAYNDFWWDSGDSVVRTRRTSLIVDPENGRLPARTSAGEERLAARRASRRNPPWSPLDLEPGTRCIHFGAAGPPMIPSAYNNNYHVVQTEDYVMIVNEMVHAVRIIPLDGRAPLHPSIRQWLGSSRGHWDGDTLVVETTNRRDDTAFQGTGENMRLTERFTRVAEDVLLYEFTVDDPENFTRPWTAQIPSVRVNDLMYEYACHEGNRGLYGILSGARAEEAAAEAAGR